MCNVAYLDKRHIVHSHYNKQKSLAIFTPLVYIVQFFLATALKQTNRPALDESAAVPRGAGDKPQPTPGEDLGPVQRRHEK